MDDKTRLDFIKLNVIKPKRNGQIRNLYNKDFEWLIEQAGKVEQLEKDIEFHEMMTAKYLTLKGKE